MTDFSPAMDAALAGAVITPFGTLKIVLPNHTMTLLDTAGVVSFGGDVYTGSDPYYGTISKIESLTDGVGDQAPALKMSFTPNTDAAATDIAAAEMQGSAFTMTIGLVELTTMEVIDTYTLFSGTLDTTTLKGGRTARSVDMVITSIFEKFLMSNDGARLSDTWHKSIWPNEQGMSFLTYIVHQIYWGGDAPSGVTQ